jgi:UDP-GlcNAc:undecaprenyl-phosphate GlcNAc-1-phosphate transferase
LLLGLSLGIVSLLAVARSTLFISLLVPIMAAGVPVIDTLMAIIRRKRAHQPVDSPDRGHIHHRLLNQGFSQPAAAGIMWAWTAALAICSIVLAESEGILRAIAIIIAAVITAYGIIKLHLVEPVLLHHYNPRNKNGKPHKNKDTNQSNNHN